MDSQNYWTRRLTRRRALAGVSAGGVGLAALGLVGCGGSSNNNSNQTIEQKQAEVQSILWQRTDTTAQAVPGGIIQGYQTIETASLDPLSAPTYTAAYYANWYYPKLLQFTPGYRVPATGGVEANLAEKWEQPDSTHTVLHLRQGAIWDKAAPTNGRVIDADDVVASYTRFAATGNQKSVLVNTATNPSAPITKVEATDKNTVVFTTAYPYAPLLASLAYSRYLPILPKEAGGGANGFDPVKDVHGGGPYTMKYQPNVAFTFRKNPDWWNASKMLNDGFDLPIIAEQASQLAQFRAKKIMSYTPPQENVIGLKSDFPELLLDKAAFSKQESFMFFGLAPDSPFSDPRVRQAVSMLIDRDTFLETFYNVSTFKNAGYPIETRWNSAVSVGWDGYWVDPQSKDMGDNAKYFQFNVAEAKKLLSAAGYNSPIETTGAYITTTQYGSQFPKTCDVLLGMLNDSGLFKVKTVNPDYTTDYLPNYYYAKGNFKGIAMGMPTAFPEIDQSLFYYYHSTGGAQETTYMGKNPDKTSDSMIEAQRSEMDPTKRVKIIQDWQRYVAGTVPWLHFPGKASSFSLTWPWYGNIGVFRAWDGESDISATAPHVWYDKSKFTG